jgi:hypothetical protein
MLRLKKEYQNAKIYNKGKVIDLTNADDKTLAKLVKDKSLSFLFVEFKKEGGKK